MGDLPSNLAKLLEENFGAAGQPITQVLIALTVAWVFLGFIEKMRDVVITPLIDALRGRYKAEVLWHISKVAMLIGILIFSFLFSNYILTPYQIQRIDDARARAEEQVVEARQQVEQAEELLTRAKEATQRLSDLLETHAPQTTREAPGTSSPRTP